MKRKSHKRSEALAALRDALSAAEIYQSRSEDVTKIFTEKLVERFTLTRYEWQYLHGWADAVVQSWYRDKLVFCVQHEGTLYKMDWNSLPEPVREMLRTRSRSIIVVPSSSIGRQGILRGLYWLNKDGTIGRPFFAHEEPVSSSQA